MQENDEPFVPTTDYSPEGVDRTLIRWMLSLTPSERLDVLQGFADSTWELLHGRDAITVPTNPEDPCGTRR